MHNAARYVLGGFAGAAIISGVGISVAMAGDSANSTGRIEVAQTSNVDGERLNSFVDWLAEKLGITPEELKAAIEETLAEEVDRAADEGELPQDLADSIQREIENGLFDREIDVEGIIGSAGGGIPDLGEIEGQIADLRAEIAAFLGTTEEELRSLLDEGMTLGEIAERFDKTPEEIANFLLEQYLALTENEDVPQEIRDGMRAALEKLIEMYIDGRLALEDLFGSP
jgi:hypothetical protein